MSGEAPSTGRRSYRKVAMLVAVIAGAVALTYAQPEGEARGSVAETAIQMIGAVAMLIIQVNSQEHRVGIPGTRPPKTPPRAT